MSASSQNNHGVKFWLFHFRKPSEMEKPDFIEWWMTKDTNEMFLIVICIQPHFAVWNFVNNQHKRSIPHSENSCEVSSKSHVISLTDMYTFDSSAEAAVDTYQSVCAAYTRLFQRLKLDCVRGTWLLYFSSESVFSSPCVTVRASSWCFENLYLRFLSGTRSLLVIIMILE